MATGGSCEAFKSFCIGRLGGMVPARRRNGVLNLSRWSMSFGGWNSSIGWFDFELFFGIPERLGFGRCVFFYFPNCVIFRFLCYFFVFRVVGQHHLTSQDPPVCVLFISYFSTGLACRLEDFVSGPRLCVETSDNVEEALDALLEEAKVHVVDFLSDRQVPGSLKVNRNGKIRKSGMKSDM